MLSYVQDLRLQTFLARASIEDEKDREALNKKYGDLPDKILDFEEKNMSDIRQRIEDLQQRSTPFTRYVQTNFLHTNQGCDLERLTIGGTSQCPITQEIVDETRDFIFFENALSHVESAAPVELLQSDRNRVSQWVRLPSTHRRFRADPLNLGFFTVLHRYDQDAADGAAAENYLRDIEPRASEPPIAHCPSFSWPRG